MAPKSIRHVVENLLASLLEQLMAELTLHLRQQNVVQQLVQDVTSQLVELLADWMHVIATVEHVKRLEHLRLVVVL